MKSSVESTVASVEAVPESDPCANSKRVIAEVHARFMAAGKQLLDEDLETLRAQQRVLLRAASDSGVGSACDTLVRLYDLSGHRDEVLGMRDAVLRDGFGNGESIVRTLQTIDDKLGVRDAYRALQDLSAERAAPVKVQSMVARIEHKLGMIEPAIERARAVLAEEPHSAMARGILVLALTDKGEIDQACDVALEAGEGIRQISWSILPLLSSIHGRDGAEARFLEIAERFLQSQPADRQYWQIQILKRIDDVEQAERALLVLLEKEPDDERWNIELAKVRLESLKWADNTELFRRALTYRGVYEGTRERLRSALHYLDYVGPTVDAAGTEDSPLAVPDSLYEYVLSKHRNLLYRPVAGKVALIGATMGPGGAERVLGVAFKSLKEAGADVSLWLYSVDAAKSDDFYLNELDIGLDAVSLVPMAEDIPEPFRWLPFGHSKKAYSLYLRILEERPEIVHGWQDGVNVDLVFAAVLAGVPRIVLHPHNMQPDLVHKTKIARSFKRVYQAALAREEVQLLCVSEASRRDYVEWTGKPDDSRTEVIYNGFDLRIVGDQEKRATREQLCELYGVPRDRFVVGAAFRFAEVKRPLLWVEVAHCVLQKLPDAHFVIFGDGTLKAKVEKRIGELGLGDRFTLPGRVQDVPRKIALLDAYLLTSESEGLPTVAIEAQYAGVPVVASNTGGVPECFIDGVTGHLIESDDPELYAEGILQVFENELMRGGVAKRAEAFLDGRFTEKEMTASLLRLYRCGDPGRETGANGAPTALDLPPSFPATPERRVAKVLIVMPWGRVGSNLLANILDQQVQAKSANETLNVIEGADEQHKWFADFYSEEDLPEKLTAIYSKQSMRAMVDPARLEQFCRVNDVKVIRMSRRSLLKGAVSQMRARQYAEMTEKEDGVARWGLLPGRKALGPTTLCVSTLLDVMAQMAQAQQSLSNCFDSCTTLDVEYEEINADLDGVVERVCTFLDTEKKDYTVKFRKATSDDLSEIIVNYDDIVNALDSSSPPRAAAA